MELDFARHRLHVEAAGSGPPDFLCLHGLVDTSAIWDPLAPALAARGQIVRFDQRGHGASTGPPGPYSREDLAADAIAVLDRCDVARAILVGHSMGGIVALATALAHPARVAGLVLLGTAGECNERVAGWYERIAVAGERDGAAGLARAIYGPDTRREICGSAPVIARVTRVLKTLHTDPLTPRLAQVRCPALLIVGERDPMGPKASARLAGALPDAELRVLPGLGHWTHVEAPEAVSTAFGTWLAAHRDDFGRIHA